MYLPRDGWKNKAGTGNRKCRCGTWKQHWINNSGKPWPNTCSIKGCSNEATLGAHIINSKISGEQIIPACYSCNQLNDEFSLKDGTTLVSANKQSTCESRELKGLFL